MSRREQFLDALGLMPEWLPRQHGVPLEVPEAAAGGGERAATAMAANATAAPDTRPASGTVAAPRPEYPGPADVDMPAPPAGRALGGEHARSNDGVSARALEIATLDWEPLARHVADCQACQLCERRTNTVFGVGDQQAEWMFIGEGPGEQEDLQGEPFVGQSGKLLDNMLRALGMSRQRNVYIANIVKCRPPRNRDPEPEEAAVCEPYLQRQIALLKPRLIVVLGKVAAHRLLRTDAPVSRLRGQVHDYEGIPVVVTYHPSYLLRSPNEKAKAWDDLCFARALHERSGPSAGRA
ncbi:uracil-DNA glycosylase [Imbroritus primus]|uniref:Uracil-DNA glycosylase n=1 Tax=Imbroritus primus TaxID=3058603 RepID=A0ACD3SRM1_9BURK|nr:uracil-DNA glycosylase [Burkholderiaceae bacterium PBA]